jgi:hypothetical protein
MMKHKTEVEAFIEREAHIPGFLERVMLADDPIMAQFHLAGGLEGIRKIHQLRQRVVGTYGFSVLTREVVNRLSPMVHFLKWAQGQDIGPTSCDGRVVRRLRPTFIYEPGAAAVPDLRYPSRRRHCFVDVIATPAQEAVREHAEKTLLMVWPEAGEDWSYEALTAYSGERLIYRGSGKRTPAGRPLP